MGVPHPELKGQPPANPEVARFYVDVMTILQAKVKGNLTAAESAELDEILYQLRMRALQLQPAATGVGCASLDPSSISPRA